MVTRDDSPAAGFAEGLLMHLSESLGSLVVFEDDYLSGVAGDDEEISGGLSYAYGTP